MDEFIHWPKPYLLLSSTCDEVLSWVIEILMKIHLVSDSNCNTVKSIIRAKKLQGITTLGSHLVLVTLYCISRLVLSKTIRIYDTKYHSQCNTIQC